MKTKSEMLAEVESFGPAAKRLADMVEQRSERPDAALVNLLWLLRNGHDVRLEECTSYHVVVDGSNVGLLPVLDDYQARRYG